ncbi:MAG: SGNH/GDSL hydrolase family protein, partial [Pirellulales bacterium]
RLVGLKFGWLRLPELEVLVGRFSARYWPVWVQVAGTDPATILQQNPPVYVARNLRHMAITAKQNDVKFAIISFVVRDGLGPDRTRSNDPPDHYRVALRRQNQIGRDVSRELGGLAIDLAAFMPSDERLWSEDGIHFTQQGNAVRARFIAEKLAENGMLPKRK